MPFIYDIPERQAPLTQELAGGEEWALLLLFGFLRPNGNRLSFAPAGPDAVSAITKPKWVTDYGSIPRAFWFLFSPTKYPGPYLGHDFLYSTEYRDDRALCDRILLEMIEEVQAQERAKMKPWKRPFAAASDYLARNTIYAAVKAAGWAVWRKHDKKKVQELRDYAAQFSI